MTDNEIIKAMQCVIGNDAKCSECTYQKALPFPSCRMMCAKNALDLINRQKAKIENIKKNLQYYLNINEENGVVYIPKFIIDNLVKEMTE